MLGVVLSLVGTLAWAGHYLFIRIGMKKGSVMGAILVACLANVVIVVPIGVGYHYPDFGLTPGAVAAFALAGLCSGLLGRIFQYKSTELIGASRTSPVVAASGLVSVVLAVAFLRESLTLPHLVGILLIVVGVALVSWETAADRTGDATPSRDSALLFVFPLLAAAFFGIEPVLVSIGLAQGTPLLIGMSIAIVASGIGFVGYSWWRPAAVLRRSVRSPALSWYVAGAVAGTVSYLAYFGALAVAPVVVVMPIFQSVPLVVVVLSVLFMPAYLERVTWRVAGAATVVVVGATLVSLSA
ncbi:GRP family sugar transporter [Halosolutus amylolyticus]|uniref:GRP family sugar transporter n=1 Tax=Halosolutus amylolyticus TaxID=2932267 RepID=A0ABD5PJR8_9EURY|nr:GRP family sugar transporter [Halosolutus amylolyticus]